MSMIMNCWQIEGQLKYYETVDFTDEDIRCCLKNYQEIIAPELYGIVRQRYFGKAKVFTTNDSVYIYVQSAFPVRREAWYERFYYYMDLAQYNCFLNYFIEQDKTEAKLDWKKWGF